jgi:hypothetical protein
MKEILAGALFDFAAWLTTRKTPVTIGAEYDAAIVAELAEEFATLRMGDYHNADVKTWSERLDKPAPKTVPLAMLRECMRSANDANYVGSFDKIFGEIAARYGFEVTE